MFRVLSLLPLILGCGAILEDQPDDGDGPDVGPDYESEAADGEVSVRDDATGDVHEDSSDPADESVRFDEATVAEDVSPEDETAVDADGTTPDADAPEASFVCSLEGCGAECASAGFGTGYCMEPGVGCFCDEATDCGGPFVGWNDDDRWVAYNIHVVDGAYCTISTCAEYTGNTFIRIASQWSGENDDFCGTGSEIVAGPILDPGPLTIWVQCVGVASCSWAITVDCEPGCEP